MQEPLPLHAIPLNTPTAEEQEEVRLRLVERDKVKMNTKLGESLEGFIITNFDSALVSLIPLFVVGPSSLISQGLASFIAFEKCLDYCYGTKVFLCTLQLKI